MQRVEGLVDLGGVGRDLGQRVIAGHAGGAQLGRDAARPVAGGLGAFELLARRGAGRGRLLAQQVVAEIVLEVVVELGQARRPDGIERGERAVADRLGRDLQQARDLAVRAPLAQHKLENGLLVGGEIVEARHAAQEANRTAAGIVPLPMDLQLPYALEPDLTAFTASSSTPSTSTPARSAPTSA